MNQTIMIVIIWIRTISALHSLGAHWLVASYVSNMICALVVQSD